ncbi:hypothetical protein MLP_49480 [Microlunatus phosphovorus NM-1]|uniref:Uncharacterized protein n=1 Tax=Microlunatus phosphovorus (strain ATCC 700054 / DSM 10555 / JCM 9379 / NBRC 101784 / NCIMB 13414 / VKM Ac-1990 / NM-1) TaxID=1032480 RepID=F5XG28_MICPN|nr:hypothetical protein [Microlunatus phosphovorus]BAK37962.1 hypothetical protein MLP_49480 [Microlunatus phosphovorus NM-1]
MDDEQLEHLRLLAELDGSNVAQVIRDAIVAYTDRQFNDPAFAARVEEANQRRLDLVQKFGQQVTATSNASKVMAASSAD